MKRLRVAMGNMSVAELARRSGVPDRTLRKYLGETSPTVEPLARIAQALDVNLNWLLLGVGEAKDPMDLAELKKEGFDPSSKDWTFLYIKRFPSTNDPEAAVPVRREWLENAGLASVAGLWLTYMPEGVGMGGDYPDSAVPGDMIICRNAFGLQEGRAYLFEYEGKLRAGHLHGIDGMKVFLPGRTSAEIATADDVIMVGEIRGKLGISEVK